MTNNLFPELNLEYLKKIVKRWVNHYEKWGVRFEEILLYRYASDYIGGGNETRYAVVFDISHYQRKPEIKVEDFESGKLQNQITVEHDPYEDFIAETGYCNAAGNKDKFIHADFGNVYDPPAQSDKEEWVKHWKFIPKHKDLFLSQSIRTDEGRVTLHPFSTTSPCQISDKELLVDEIPPCPYSRHGIGLTMLRGEEKQQEITDTIKDLRFSLQELKKDNGASIPNSVKEKDPSATEKRQENNNQRAFVLSGDYFKISFDGKEANIKDKKGVRYVLEALKHPGEPVKYMEIDRIVNGEAPFDGEQYEQYQDMTKEQLLEEGLAIDNEQSRYDRKTAEEALKYVTNAYLSGKDCEKAICVFEKEYGFKVIKKNDCLTLGGEIKDQSKEYEKIRKKINARKNDFLKKLENKFPELHYHFQLYLRAYNGLQYHQPENEPTWQIED